MQKPFYALFLAAALLAACGNNADNPAGTAQTFFTELFEGNTEKALDLIYFPPEALKGTNEETAKIQLNAVLTVLQEQVKKQGGMESITAGEAQYNADKTQATVPVTLKAKNGDTDTETVILIKTGQGWKVKPN